MFSNQNLRTIVKVQIMKIIISKKQKPVFCILHVLIKTVLVGTDSPSPIVMSLTKDIQGTLSLGCSKS